jgi:hypothetical protein
MSTPIVAPIERAVFGIAIQKPFPGQEDAFGQFMAEVIEYL